jgi:methionyl aminopeptidase
MTIKIYSPADFAKMRQAGALAASVLDYITEFVKVDVTTNELNRLCHDFIIANNAVAAPLNYRGFPKSICTSVNHVVCHGIPNDNKLKNGDIINIDVTVILDGWYGDTSRMFYVGPPSVKARRLVEATYAAMMLGIEQVKPGASFSAIGRAIESYINKQNFSVVRDFCGHGIGKVFHDEPNVLHYYEPSNNQIMEEGMFFTIEPMINAGKWQTIVSKIDGWTATTRDKSLSAQFEHTIGVTATGFEIFTISPKGFTLPPYE